jgi:hypothetical protein
MATTKPKLCWYCNFFQPSQPTVNRSGWCRRHAPAGIDEKAIIDREYYDEFPAVKDGSVEWCNDFASQSTAILPLP